MGNGAAEQGEQGIPVVIAGGTVAAGVPTYQAPLDHDDLAAFGQRSHGLHGPAALGGAIARVDINMP